MPDNVKDNPVEKREALLADRLRLHKGYRQRFVKGRNRHGRIHAFHQSLRERGLGGGFPTLPTACGSG